MAAGCTDRVVRGYQRLRLSEAVYDTKAHLLWDDEYLYISAVLEEPNIVANLTQRDTIIYHDNDFEVFLDPTGDGQNYFEIENNARGVIFDLMLDRAYRSGGNFHIQWDCPGLSSPCSTTAR